MAAHSLCLWRMGTPALSWVTSSASYDDYHYEPHLHTFLFPVVCHSPQALGSPPQRGSCNPPLGPLRLEGGGLYLWTRKKKWNLLGCRLLFIFKLRVYCRLKDKSEFSWRCSMCFSHNNHNDHSGSHAARMPISIQLLEMMTSHTEGLWNEEGVIVIQRRHWKNAVYWVAANIMSGN